MTSGTRSNPSYNALSVKIIIMNSVQSSRKRLISSAKNVKGVNKLQSVVGSARRMYLRKKKNYANNAKPYSITPA